MNRIKSALNSRFVEGRRSSHGGRGRGYTIPRVASETRHVNQVLDQVLTSAETPPRAGIWRTRQRPRGYVVTKFTTSPRLKPQFAIWLDRKTKYQPMISAKLTERAMPQT